jgi:hypothetical protein
MSDAPDTTAPDTTAPDIRTTVSVLLAAAGLEPSPAEFQILLDAYPLHKRGIESLYAIPEARYEAPALIFDPTPVFADWAS